MGKRERKYNRILKEYFGYDALKPQQFRIIDRIVEAKKDTLAILATGFGKSLCYQMPFLITGKTVIVVSPLIALMEDQSRELDERDIPVCCLSSNNPDKKADMKELYDGEEMVVYSTPEFLTNCRNLIEKLAAADRLACIAIDESHCVSNWSDKSFRPEYKQLHKLRKWAPRVPILALTATASEKVQEDIITYLSLDRYRVIKGSFDRPNLYISVHRKSGRKGMRWDLLPLVKKFTGQFVIIYARTRKVTEAVAKELSSMGTPAQPYHAGMSKDVRNKVQEQFMDGTVKCIVATIAFGMGINNRHVRLIIHYGCPSDLESYYQEIGRAGRDGERSECHLFYDDGDFRLSRMFLKEIENPDFKRHKGMQIDQIEAYVHRPTCRRQLLLAHFGEETDDCGNCDNCKSTKKQTEATEETYLLCDLLTELEVNFGRSILVGILRGSKSKKMIPAMQRTRSYGRGKGRPEKWWNHLFDQLNQKGFLERETYAGGFGNSVWALSPQGRDWYRARKNRDKAQRVYIAN